MGKVLVTGASGFIGQYLCKALSASGRSVRGVVRSLNFISKNTDIEYISVANIDHKCDWKDVLIDVDCIIHCAGRAHIMNEKKVDSLKLYQSINVDGTKQLAEEAAIAGVKRMIFLSSVKVNGENTFENVSLNDDKKKIFMYNDLPNPKDSYAISKFEAENVLWEVSDKTGLNITIFRLPIVYGYGVKGNLAKLIKIIKSGIPLPLGNIKNQRSMIGIDNLVDVLIISIDHLEAIGKTFLVSDGEDLSTTDLVRHIAFSMDCNMRLFPVSDFLLKLAGNILGKTKEIDRVVGSLKVDNSYTREVLNWTPPLSVVEGIRRMVKSK